MVVIQSANWLTQTKPDNISCCFIKWKFNWWTKYKFALSAVRVIKTWTSNEIFSYTENDFCCGNNDENYSSSSIIHLFISTAKLQMSELMNDSKISHAQKQIGISINFAKYQNRTHLVLWPNKMIFLQNNGNNGFVCSKKIKTDKKKVAVQNRQLKKWGFRYKNKVASKLDNIEIGTSFFYCFKRFKNKWFDSKVKKVLANSLR